MAEKLEIRVSMGAGDGDRGPGEEGAGESAHEFAVNSSSPKCEAAANGNGFSIATDSDPCEGSSGGAMNIRTYKRRKQLRKSNSDGDCRLDERTGAAVATFQLENQTPNESLDRASDDTESQRVHSAPTIHYADANGSSDNSQRQWCRIILEQIYQSLSDDSGVRGCIENALAHAAEFDDMKIKEPEFYAEVRPEHSTQAGLMHDGDAFQGASNGSLDESDKRTVNQMCQRALYDVVISRKFTLLCKLLVENFEGTKIDRLVDFGIINSRMKEGIYERSPALFLSDLKQVWGKLQEIGSELVSLAKSLSDITRASCHEHVGGLSQSTSGVGNCEVNGQGPQCDAKWEQAEGCVGYKVCTCRLCGEKADGRECLICDSCEEMYHVSCIQPAVEEIPPKNWYCTHCIATGIRSTHDNCAVCKKLNASRSAFNGGDENGEAPSNTEEELEHGKDDDSGKSNDCKVCGSGFFASDKIRKCGHSFCLNKFYHERCLTAKQLQSYGPLWYCPSCLCRTCLTDQDDDKIILCDGCDHAYHIYCLKPALSKVPSNKWFCRKCEAGIQAVLRVKRAYEGVKKNKRGRKKKDKTGSQVPGKKKDEETTEVSDKGGGMDMLLSAAKTLNYEENLAAVHMGS